MSQLNMRNLWWILWSVVIIFLDQVTKNLALVHLSDGHSIVLLPMMQFTLAFNPGAAFSFLGHASGWQNPLFTAIAVIVSGSLVVWLLKSKSRWQNLALSLLIGGALGNAIDRIRYGYVVDFIDAHISHHHWPIFNIADSAICAGVFILFVVMVQSPSSRALEK